MMVTGVVYFIVFALIVAGRYAELDAATLASVGATLRWWAGAMLIFIGSSIVVRIVMMILYSIAYRIVSGEDPPAFDDERDKIIELKVNQISQTAFIIGFVGSLVLVVTGGSPAAMFVTIAAAGLLSEVIGETSRIVMYRRGV